MAAGNSVPPTSYSFVDWPPVHGCNYYHLRQVDQNGKFLYTSTRMLLFDALNIQLAKAHPVSATSVLKVEIPGARKDNDVTLNLSNVIGMKVQQIRSPGGGASYCKLIHLGQPAPGVYTFQGVAQNFNSAQKLIKHKFLKAKPHTFCMRLFTACIFLLQVASCTFKSMITYRQTLQPLLSYTG